MNIKVLMLTTDRKIFEPGSKAAERIEGYRSFADVRMLLVTKDVPKALREGKHMLASWRPDVVSVQDPFVVGLIGWILAMRAGAPLHVQIHTDFMNPAYIYESLRHMIESLIARFVLIRASCVRVVSERIAKDARRLTRAPVSVLPIRVTLPESGSLTPSGTCLREGSQSFTIPIPPEFSEHCPTFITVSRLTPEKRVHLAIDALSAVPGAELCVIGEGRLRARLMARAHRRGVSSRVRFLGWVRDLAPYYAHAAAFIQMSRYEGYGVAAMEAALAGCPIITTDVGAVGEVFSRDSVRVVSGSARTLEEAMHSVLADLATKEKARKAAAEAARAVMGETEYHRAYARSLGACLS